METIYFHNCPELINPHLKRKDVKRIIKDKTGIQEENQRFQVLVDPYFKMMKILFGMVFLLKYMTYPYIMHILKQIIVKQKLF